MVLAHHVIFTAYGFWLPNDPRGSWSVFVRSWELSRHGRATNIDTRRSVANTPHDQRSRQAAKRDLQYEPVEFTGQQALCIARGFAQAIAESSYVAYACSILPAHVHMILKRHENMAERMVGHFKARATQQLAAAGLHPFARYRDANGRFPSVWGHRSWKVFLNSEADIERAIDYVRNNPVKDGKKMQNWSFVTPYV
jgi:REP element-mobilizing transposase RayT